MELDVTDAAAVLDAPPRTVKYWFKTGRIPANMPFGSRYGYRITADKLRTFIINEVRDDGVRAARLDTFLACKRATASATPEGGMLDPRE